MLSHSKVIWLLEFLAEDCNWTDLPSDGELLECLDRARNLAENHSAAASDAAALLFAFSADSSKLRDAVYQLPVALAFEQLIDSGLELSSADAEEAVGLQRMAIDEGLSWGEVLAWFKERARPVAR